MVPPTVQITAPSAGASLTGLVSVTADATDDAAGLAQVRLAVDGQVQSTRTSAPYTFALPTVQFAPGSHTLTVQATDRAGNGVEASFAVEIQPQIQVQITSPTDGSTVLYSPILVQGTVAANVGEVGVTVNGYVAEAQGGRFAVDGVALEAGANTVTATATDGAGVTVTATANVTAVSDPPNPPVTLTAESPSSLAPAPVTFEVDTQLTYPVVSYQIDFDGNGTIDFTGSTFVGVSHLYSVAGLYLPTVFVTDTQGQTFSARTVVNLWDRVTIDTLLQSKWTGMKAALFNNDVDTALEAIAFTARDGYRELFTALTSQFGQVDLILRDISFVSIAGGLAEYQMIRVDNGVRLSYFVLFVKDVDGVWRLKFF
jgi:hypothetical protein